MKMEMMNDSLFPICFLIRRSHVKVAASKRKTPLQSGAKVLAKTTRTQAKVFECFKS